MNIVLKNLTKKFDGNTILDDVNITFELGNVYGFIGKNGSGKSVLFKLLCGFYKPTSGTIFVGDCDINLENKFLIDARALIEKPNFIPTITGFENLKLLAEIQNKIGDEEIYKALEIVNLSIEDANKLYRKYSLGMKQKIGIAQVIMENPKIMIFDEPFNGIEENTVLKISKYIKSISKNKIIILASHYKEEINELCDIIYKIELGKVTKQ